MAPGSPETQSTDTPSSFATPSSLADAAREALQNTEGLEQLVQTLQAVCAKEQQLQRSHSFQLVKVQSQIHELQQHRAEDVTCRSTLRDDVNCLQSAVAYLKGRIASLTIEMTCLETRVDQRFPAPKRFPSTAANQPVVTPESRALKPRHEQSPGQLASAAGTLKERLDALGGSMDALADELLRDQKQKLLEKLATFPLGDTFCLDLILRKGTENTS
ncbi:hypothetical protein OCS_01027 [Ophiocordyceps sinensis CO18]|uniref:Uncharacterized protein n=1 Tax=Ophiocordyceps sinensis (strain Co18 / CGMCC 3.14243) TaxID=911162 RepID=T5ANF2_OPHSC|nr:hypothetical protein OCS_01027 [Ophiocordyceps sinensis CO18]